MGSYCVSRAAHDDVQARGASYSDEGYAVSAHVDPGAVHDRLAAPLLEQHGIVDCLADVAESEQVCVSHAVVARVAERFLSDGSEVLLAGACFGGGLSEEAEIVEHHVTEECYSELVGLDGAGYGLDFSCGRLLRHGLPPGGCWAGRFEIPV